MYDENNTINIAYIVDAKYVMPTCVSIVSLKQNRKTSGRIKVFIIANRLSPTEKNIFIDLQEENFLINMIEVDDETYLKEIQKDIVIPKMYVTPTALLKFQLPDLIDEDRVLYLDGDLLIQGDLEELYNWDIQDAYLGAVDDVAQEKEDGISHWGKRIGLDTEHYFNSGVLLLNLKRMREDRIPKRLLDYRCNHVNYFMDQDAFNYVCGGNRTILPLKYNFIADLASKCSTETISEVCFGDKKHTIENCMDEAVILHMAGAMKPWVYHIPNVSERFLQYYSCSAFSDKPLVLQSAIKFLLDQARDKEQEVLKTKVWKFPYKKIKRGSRIILYGAGQVGRDYYSQLEENEYCKVILWVDNNYKNIGAPISPPEELSGVNADYILIAVSQIHMAEQIKADLGEKYPERNIVMAIEAFA